MEPDVFSLLSFVQKHSYLYNNSNCDFFSKELINLINTEWLSFLSQLSYDELNIIPSEFQRFQKCPSSLKEFFSKALELTALSDNDCTNIEHLLLLKEIKVKKKYELIQFYKVLKSECENMKVNRIVDGHMLNYFLNQNSLNVECIGVESNQTLCSKAIKKYENIKFENFKFSFGDDICRKTMFGRNLNKTDNLKCAIISLHGCGNLQTNILREFVYLKNKTENSELGNVSLLMTIGCCYHKTNYFDEWPMSNKVRTCLQHQKFKTFKLPIYAFRLACQERMSRWKKFSKTEHDKHKQEFCNRALIQCIYESLNINCKINRKQNRKLGKTLDEFISQLLKINKITSIEDSLKWTNTINTIINRFKNSFKFIEPFTALQFTMQGPMETLILWDRVWYLRENGCVSELIPVFNSFISPRNMCIVAKLI